MIPINEMTAIVVPAYKARKMTIRFARRKKLSIYCLKEVYSTFKTFVFRPSFPPTRGNDASDVLVQ